MVESGEEECKAPPTTRITDEINWLSSSSPEATKVDEAKSGRTERSGDSLVRQERHRETGSERGRRGGAHHKFMK